MKYKNKIIKLLKKLRKVVFIFSLLFIISVGVFATQNLYTSYYNSAYFPQANDLIINDSVAISSIALSDSINIDTSKTDSSSSSALLDSPIDYNAVDSILFSLDNKKVYLYGDAEIKYQNMELKSDFIELDLDKNEIYAIGLPDSSGKIAGEPVFKEDDETYEAKEMRYNFKTRKGIIKEVKTEESDGYLHADRTKRQNNGEIHMRRGKYTTCDADHPHFYMALTKAKVIPNDKIVSGPAYMVVADVPLYFPIIPFGFFPNTRKHSSGVILPTYGEEEARGFYLERGGYYFAINDYFDLTLLGDFYTKGTWGVSSLLNYRKRYRFSGRMNIRYYSNATGDIDIPSTIDIFEGGQERTNDFSVVWSHTQDAKANPYNRLSASVNFSTNTFNENHTRRADNYLNNRKQSNISFSKSWPNRPFSLSANIRHNQNKLSDEEKINFDLPSLNFNVSRQYPFRSKKGKKRPKWIENIGFDYKSQLQNKLYTNDSLFFNHLEFEKDKNDFGFKHSVPLSTSIKFLRFFTFSPGVSYNGMVYTKKIVDRYWDWENEEETRGSFKDSIVEGFNYIHGYAPRASVSINPVLYGMYMFKKGSKVEAIRHVFDPNVSFSFVPDMKNLVADYYDSSAINPLTGKREEYSIYEGGMYGTPTLPGRSGNINFSLRNNVEMKIKKYTDTTQEVKKIKIIDNLSMSTSYNVYADETRQQKWRPIGMSTSNRFFNGKLNIRFTATGNMYAIDSLTEKAYTDKFIWESTDKILRITNGRISFGTSFSSSQGKKEKSETQDTEVEQLTNPELELYPGYVDFDVPWNFSFDYSFVYSKPGLSYNITQTLNFSGNLSLTPKWKITFRSGWDFDKNKLTYTTFSLHRDLHCWEARFNWVPFGRMKSYGFTITAKSSILRDLKWDKPKESWYDNR